MNRFAHTAGGRAGYTSGTPRRMIVVRSCAARPLGLASLTAMDASDEALPWGGGEYSTPHLAARASLATPRKGSTTQGGGPLNAAPRENANGFDRRAAPEPAAGDTKTGD